jgi:signal transduction histidine kinase
LGRPTSKKRAPATERLSGRSLADYRRLFNRILSSSGEGRITLAVLKDISRMLQRFYGCTIVEIVYKENQKLLHVKTVKGTSRITSGWKERQVGHTDICDFIESIPSDPLRRFKARRHTERKKGKSRRIVYHLAGANSSEPENHKPKGAYHVFLLIPARSFDKGVLAMSFPRPRAADHVSNDFLNRLASLIGITLSHNLSRFELRERVKELSCIYSIANLAVSSDQSMEMFLQSAAELLPQAYLYPEITEARITFEDRTYQTGGFVDTQNSQKAAIVIGGNACGMVEVMYRESRPEMDEGPFLVEERRLLDSVAREIALIIERKQAEIERNRLKEQLRHADRLATIGKLASGVAHELNEPLTGILGFAELLKEFPGMPAQPMRDIERIESAALHGREVVRKLLLFARQISPRQSMVDINGVVQDVVSFLGGRCRQQGIRTQMRLDDGLPEVRADESQIRQVVMNLMVNALQAMENGGRLTITTKFAEGRTMLSVRDTGTGIPDDIKDKIFLPFFTTKETQMGTGIGLSVVHGIVKSHGGDIEASSVQGTGTEFRVWLPAK